MLTYEGAIISLKKKGQFFRQVTKGYFRTKRHRQD